MLLYIYNIYIYYVYIFCHFDGDIDIIIYIYAYIYIYRWETLVKTQCTHTHTYIYIYIYVYIYIHIRNIIPQREWERYLWKPHEANQRLLTLAARWSFWCNGITGRGRPEAELGTRTTWVFFGGFMGGDLSGKWIECDRTGSFTIW